LSIGAAFADVVLVVVDVAVTVVVAVAVIVVVDIVRDRVAPSTHQTDS